MENNENGKMLGKIIIRTKKGNTESSFSPNCCFDKENPLSNLYPITKGVNEITCKCGRKYRVTVPGLVTEFKSIVREELLPEPPKEIVIK